MNYHDVRQKELETTKNLSLKGMNRYIKFHRILLSMYSKIVFWSLSFIIVMLLPLIFGQSDMYLLCLIVHFIFWHVVGEKMYHRDCDKEIEELELTIQVLEDIKKEKFNTE
jgi:hypothetical protein